MSTARSWGDFLADLAESVQHATSFVEGMTYDEFLADTKTQFAVARALEIAGEAAKRIPDEIRDRYSTIPWRAMAGMRDKLSHAYFGIKPEVVWKTVIEDLPAIDQALRRIAPSLG